MTDVWRVRRNFGAKIDVSESTRAREKTESKLFEKVEELLATIKACLAQQVVHPVASFPALDMFGCAETALPDSAVERACAGLAV